MRTNERDTAVNFFHPNEIQRLAELFTQRFT